MSCSCFNMFRSKFLGFIVLFGLILSSQSSIAKDNHYSASFDHVAINGSGTLTLTDPVYNVSAIGSDCNLNLGRVALVLDRAYSDPISLTHPLVVNATVKAFGRNSTVAFYNKAIDFNVDPRNVVQAAVNVLDPIDIPGAYKLEITVNSVQSNSSAVSCPANVSFELQIFSQRINSAPTLTGLNLRHELHDSYADPSLITGTSTNTEYSAADFMLVKWDGIDYVEGYELEWTYVDIYLLNEGKFWKENKLEFASSDFENNASRVFVENGLEYRIPLLYDKGFLVYRMRAVYKDACDAEYLLYTDWTHQSCNGFINCFSSNYQLLAGHERNLNWQASRSFAEDAKSRESISYFDGSQRNRQSLAYVNSDANVVVSEQYYDYLGRPAVQALPVPGESKINFHEDFNQAGGNPYGPSNFDLNDGSCGVVIDAMDNNFGTARYYSSNNPNQNGANAYIPDAAGFPFSQVEYEPDQTGRIRRQGGVGSNYQLGSDHETKYYYGTPDQEELDRLFGTDVGFARFYKKQIVVDPNGQSTITYLDQTEKTIATALTGNVPGSLQALPGGVSTLTNYDMLAKDAVTDPDDEQDRNFRTQNGLGLEANYTLLQATSDNFDASYSLNIPPFTDACFNSGTAYSPVATTNFSVFDNNCLTELYNGSLVTGAYNTAATGNSVGSIVLPTLPNLAAGSYKINKNLQIDLEALENYANQYVLDANCLTPYSTFFDQAMTLLDASICDDMFDETPISTIDAYNDCVAQLGDPANYTPQEYADLLEDCMEAFSVPNIFDNIYEMMLEDVSPGGQYGFFSVDANGDFFSNDPLSVYNTNPTFTANDHPNVLPARLDNVTINYPGPGGSVSQTIALWDPAWADIMVSYHPEWAYYNNYMAEYRDKSKMSQGVNTIEYEYLLRLVNDWGDLSALNSYYKVHLASGSFDLITGWSSTNFPILDEDPYFTGTLSAKVNSQRTALIARLQNVDGNGNDLYNYAAKMARCSNWYGTDPCTITGAFNAGSSTLVKQREWAYLVSMYLRWKQAIIYDDANEEAIDLGGPGGKHVNIAIGENDFQPVHWFIQRYIKKTAATGMAWPTQLNSWAGVANEIELHSITGILTSLYAEKQRRVFFVDPYFDNQINETDPTNTSKEEEELYAETGLCPLAINLEAMVEDVLVNHNPVGILPLLGVDGFSIKLYELFKAAPANTAPFDPFQWRGTLPTTTNLAVDITNTGGLVTRLSLNFASSSAFNWLGLGTVYDIVRVRKIVPDASLNSGTLYGFVLEVELLSGGNTYVEVLNCTIDGYDLTNCSSVLTNISQANQLGSSFTQLFTLLAQTGTPQTPPTPPITDFTEVKTPSLDLLSGDYNNLFSQAVRKDLESLSGRAYSTYSWEPSSTSSTEFIINAGGGQLEYRLFFCSEPSWTDGFQNLDYYFRDLRPVDPANTPSCSIGFTPNFQVEVVRLTFGGGAPVSTSEVLFGYADIYDPNAPTLNGGNAGVVVSDINFGYVARPYQPDPGSYANCENNKDVRLRLQQFLNSAMPLNYSDGVYDGTAPDLLDESLYRQFVNSLTSFSTLSSTGAVFYIGEEYSQDPTMYFGTFYNGHGRIPTSNIIYNSETGTYSSGLDGSHGNDYGLYDCLVQMRFADASSPHSFGDVTAISNLQGLPGTYVDGLTTQFSALVLVNGNEWVEVIGESCFQISECKDCTEKPLRVPTNCADDYNDYLLHVQGPLGLELPSVEDYCSWGVTCLADYISYLQAFNITSETSPYFIPLSSFCNMDLGYYLNYYFNYMPTILGGGTPANFSSFLPGTYSNQFPLLDEFALAGVGNACVVAYSTYYSGDPNQLGIVDYCSEVGYEFPCPRLEFTPFPTWEVEGDPCGDMINEMATANALNAYNSYLSEIKEDFKLRYVEHILSSAWETFDRASSSTAVEHFMLYYYDQAGNLTRTVSPAAVKPIPNGSLASVKTARIAGNDFRPNHVAIDDSLFTTTYQYNSLNQLIWQRTPDGGITEFWYDNLGRIVLSQNAKQKLANKYTYTLYDELGRPIESGQINYTGNIPSLMMEVIEGGDWVSRLTAPAPDREEVTKTIYSNPSAFDMDLLNYYQQFNPNFDLDNLINRVALSSYYELITSSTSVTDYNHATFYSYDVHGNVKTLIQDFKAEFYIAGEEYHRFKRMDYDYDLVSGNVNRFIYQPGLQDQFIHKYSYDADNRIESVQTSRDGRTWELDANYEYLPHGPLSRKVIGSAEVQGQDFAYTLQGWLKSVNSSILHKNYDQGSDGVNNHTSRDAYSFSLHYNYDDYTPISSIAAPFQAHIKSGFYELYNGNIMAMATSFWDNTETPVKSHLNRYKYDQLHRLVETHSFYDQTGANLVEENNNFGHATHNNDYRVRLTYDANGNILTANRKGVQNGTGTQGMDNMTYNYTPYTNRLDYVRDLAPDGNYSMDADGQTAGNYDYDAIGNIVGNFKDEIETIDWTVNGNVKEVIRIVGSTLPAIKFRYDASGNRIAKEVNNSSAVTTTYYVRDASGNAVATYSKDPSDVIRLNELNIYGSDRLGLLNSEEPVLAPVVSSACAPALGSPSTLPVYSVYRYWEPCYLVGAVQEPISFLDVATGGGTEIVSIKAVSGSIVLESQSGTFLDGQTGNSVASLLIPSGQSRSISYSNSIEITPGSTYEISALTSHVVHDFGGKSQLVYQGATYQSDQKKYELKNHLGNVIATVEDYKYWKTFQEPSYIIDEDFTHANHFASYQPIGDAILGPNVPGSQFDINGQSPGDGVSRSFSMTAGCTYDLCVALGFEPLNGTLTIRIMDGATPIETIEVPEIGEYCFEGITVGTTKSYTLEIFSSDVDIIYLNQVRLRETCSVQELIADVWSSQDYYPFGMEMPERVFGGDYRFGFQDQEADNEFFNGGDAISFKYRIHDPRLGRFFSLDPLAKEYPHNSPYAFSENRLLDAIELEGLEAFFIHGTTSSPDRWNPKSVSTLMGLTNNKTAIKTFSWEDLDGLRNNSNDRYEAAKRLVEHIKANRVEGEEVTLIGHSHGGNVSIQAAKLFYQETGERVNLITIATPAYNTPKDGNPLMEDPNTALGKKSIFHHLQLFNEIDGVQGGLAGEDRFNLWGGDGTYIRTSGMIDVSDYYKSYEWLDAHSFDVEHPESIQKAIDNGQISPLRPVPQQNDNEGGN